ncbi:MAG: translation initiation factor IF-2 [Nannocystaceae bacterium]
MAKIRVYELARELGQDNKALEKIIRDLSIPIKNYMSTLAPDQADVVRRELGAKTPPRATPGTGTAPIPAAASRRPTVRRRRAAGPRPAEKEAAAEAAALQEAAEAAEAAAAAVAQQAQQVAEQARVAPSRPQAPLLRRPAVSAGGPSVLGEAAQSATVPSAAAQQLIGYPDAVASRQLHDPRGGVSASSRPRDGRALAPASDLHGTHAHPTTEAPIRDGRTMSSDASVRVSSTAAGSDSRPLRGGVGVASAIPEVLQPTPAVGSRIELPKGTRRLPGGMASRLRAPAREPGEGSGGPVVIQARASTPAVSENGAPATPVATAAVAPAEGRVGSDPTRRKENEGRRVLRNEAGVIVGTAPERSEPKILGFIPLEQRRPRPQVIITEIGKTDAKGRATRRKQREERAQQQGRRRKSLVRRPGGKIDRGGDPVRPAAEMSEAKKRIRVDEAIQVSELAHAMGQKSAKIIRTLWGMGMRGITINHAIDAETADLVATEFGYSIENVAFQEEALVGDASASEGATRAPVVTIMGHVDHGKTSLLDYVRAANVAVGEAGGITQHVGAYRVDTPRGAVVFLDTPGHQAFSSMRARGAQVTDIVVLVVAADDGVMPTTVEAIRHAKEANVPIVVAVNKVDKPDSNVGRVKQMLMEHGLVGEEFGGETIICEVSAKTGQGVSQLLEMLALQAEVLDLRAPADGRATGIVIEARVDKGRGPVACVLVQSGRLGRGDIAVSNEFFGRIRGIFDDSGAKLSEAFPSTPVEVLGLDGVPSAGDRFHVVESERDAKQLVSHRRDSRRRKESVKKGPSVFERIQKKKTPFLKIVLRGDVQGSAEALHHALEEMSVEKVRVEVIFSGVGAITENDVKRAKPAGAVILGFNVKPAGKAGALAETDKVPIHLFGVIYEATERVEELMIDLLEPEYRERERGEAEVRELFPIPRLGLVCGCRVLRGSLNRASHVRVRRGEQIVHTGTIASLRRFKDDVKEVNEGAECGIVIAAFSTAEPGDVIEAFDLEALRPQL